MNSRSHRTGLLVIMLIVAFGAPLPLMHYLRVKISPTVTVEEAVGLLAESANVVILDVRSAEQFARVHVEGSINAPLAKAMTLPGETSAETILVLCNSGSSSAIAARRISRAHEDVRVFNVSGGIEAWIAHPRAGELLRTDDAVVIFRESSSFEQFIAFASGFIIKPFYMLLSLVLIILLRKQKESDLMALRWGLIAFLAGESACALNYLLFGEQSYVMEYLHSLGMVLSFGFTAYAVLEALDIRLVKYSNTAKPCAVSELCRTCGKVAAAPCALKRIFLLAIPCHIMLALMPFTASIHPVTYVSDIYGTRYTYFHSTVHQFFEIRYAPAAAVILFAASFLVLAFKKKDPVHWSKVLLAGGLGAFGFGMLRLLIFAAYRHNLVWFIFWEEATELLFVMGAAAILWILRAANPTSAVCRFPV